MKEEKKSKLYSIYKIIMIVAIAMFLTFMITSISFYKYWIDNPSKIVEKSDTKESDITSKLKTYRKLIDQYYLGDVDDSKLEEGAIAGYIAGLGDQYTEYISKEQMQSYLDDTKGNYVGIGIYMTKNTEKNRIQVLSTIKNSPAESVGLKSGDLIIKIDGTEYFADDMSKAADYIKGEEGTTVKLEILRDEENLTFDIKREKVKINNVEGKVLSNNIGYIGFTSFDESTSEDFKNKYEELSKQGITSLIIDLRNNGGGIVSEALKVADFMTDKDSVLLYEVDKNGNEKVNKAKDDPIINMPIIILTNENTASASEILAGALKDLGKAKIVGTKTYGKGVIQQIMTLTDGSGLKITIEEYQTPNKNKINKVGIEPDEVVELPKELKDKVTIEEKDDTQLQKAIELLSENK